MSPTVSDKSQANKLLLQIFFSSTLDLALSLRVGRLRASVFRSDRMGLKEQLIRGLWLTQAREREGYRMRGEPAVAEASVTLQQPEATPCVLLGKLSLDHGTLAVAGCIGSQEGRCG